MLVSIDQCYFRGTEPAIAKARKALAQTRFPVVGDAEFVILRQLKVRAEAAQLGKLYFQQSEKLISNRVYGWSDAAVQADCIWFSSEIDLLACLSNDIVQVRADRRWFWKNYSRFTGSSVTDSLARLFQQQAGNFPNIIQRLYEQRVLFRVWNAISEQMAASLIDLSVAETVRESMRKAFPEQEQSGDIKTAIECPPLLSILLPADTPLSTNPTARQQLAIILYLQLEKPHWLQSASSILLISQFLQQVSGISRTDKDDSIALTPPQKTVATRTDQSQQNDFNFTQISPTENQPLEFNPPTFENDTLINLTDPSSTVNSSDSTLYEQVDAQRNKLNAIDELSDQQDQSLTAKQWSVTQGGFFYLLNILNQPIIRQQLLGDEKALAFPTGWGWLYRLGEAFGLQPEDQLLSCLSALSGVDKNTFLTTTPELEIVHHILTYAERRYQGYGVWKPDLLNRRATIVYTRPELSIIFSMQDIDTDLRRCGLDIDPAWIDWLGTMVRFHYRDSVL